MDLDDFFPDDFLYKIVSNEIIDYESFAGEYRVALKSVRDFRNWLRAFEEKTNTTWSLNSNFTYDDERTFYIMSRIYICQYSPFRKRKRDNSTLQQIKEQNCTASISAKIKRKNKHTRDDPYVQEGFNGVLKVNFKHSHSIYDSKPWTDCKAWAWLKTSKKMKNTFTKYFSFGMSPPVAIKHHECMLCFEDPELLTNSRRNPPKEWIYALHESWLKEKDNKTPSFQHDKSNTQRKLPGTFDVVNKKADTLDKISNGDLDDPPCVIHMNSKLSDDCDDLKYLVIPDEVKNLFYDFFDDGLNASEAMRLNQEILKRGKKLSKFNPSQRLINYMYSQWCQQLKLYEVSYRNSGTPLIDKMHLSKSNVSFKDSNVDNGQNLSKNCVSSPQLIANLQTEKPNKFVSQDEVNHAYNCQPMNNSNRASSGIQAFGTPSVNKMHVTEANASFEDLNVGKSQNINRNCVSSPQLIANLQTEKPNNFASQDEANHAYICQPMNNSNRDSSGIQVLGTPSMNKIHLAKANVSFEDLNVDISQNMIRNCVSSPQLANSQTEKLNKFVSQDEVIHAYNCQAMNNSNRASSGIQILGTPSMNKMHLDKSNASFEDLNVNNGQNASRNYVSLPQVIANPETEKPNKFVSQVEVNRAHNCQAMNNSNRASSSQLIANAEIGKPDKIIPQDKIHISPVTANEVLLPPSQTISSSLSVTKNFNVTSKDTVEENISQAKEGFSKSMPVSPKVDYAFDPLQNQLIAINSQNSVMALVNSAPVLVNSVHTNPVFSGNQFSSSTSNGKDILNTTNCYMLSNKENICNSSSSSFLNYFPEFYSKSSDQPAIESSKHCQPTFSYFNDPKISYSDVHALKELDLLQPVSFDESNSCFGFSSVNNESHNFHMFLDKASESVSKTNMGTKMKEWNPIYLSAQQNSTNNSFMADASRCMSRSFGAKEMLYNEPKMNNLTEPDELNYLPSSITAPLVNPSNNISVSFGDNEGNEECVGLNETIAEAVLKIASFGSPKKSEDHKFLVSLLPEFECIPDGFKTKLKSDMLNLVLSTKSAAEKGKKRTDIFSWKNNRQSFFGQNNFIYQNL